ncbi:LCP family protein [Gryllotalpicola ginsengisoli]|uniref:LCP family protein n=1 Tax=Gryllotalpicola ginsengisoli TaxID=444608 RepID=UPI00138AC63B|nr:LCP family protein [Gryllotalpicola ginsengisoli]
MTPEEPTRRAALAHRRETRKKTVARRTIGWTAFGLAALLVVVAGYVGYNYFNFQNGVTKISGVIDKAKGDKDVDGKAQNILLVGVDERPANMTAEQYKELSTTPDGGGLNTDTIILLHVPADGSSATLISFPRDSLVTIPGFGQNKINAAYVLGRNSVSGTTQQQDAAGMKLLIKTVEGVTGLSIDHYVKVTLLSFYTIAKALGPVTVCLNEAVDDPYSGANFKAGKQQLNATQALQFVRQRHGLPNGDFDRAVRQQYFLSVEAQQVLSAGTLLNPVKLNNVVSAVSSALETDSGLNLASLALQMKGLKGGNIQSATIPLATPSTGSALIDGQELSVDFLDYAAIPGFIAQVIGDTGAPDAYKKAKTVDPSTVSVDVLNGAGTANGSSTALATLAQVGFQTGTPQDAPQQQQATTIYYPVGMEAQAKTVAQYFPDADVSVSPAYQKVTVILGTDGKMPQTTPYTPPAKTSTPKASKTSTPSSSSTPSATASTPTKNYNADVCVN